VAGGWWLVAGGWWLVAGGWWLVAGGCGPAQFRHPHLVQEAAQPPAQVTSHWPKD